MRITKNQLKNIIRDTINEAHMDHGSETTTSSPIAGDLMKMVSSCMEMKNDPQKFFMMCTLICSKNSNMSAHCMNLCCCLCENDSEGCRMCLSKICECPGCCEICKACCC